MKNETGKWQFIFKINKDYQRPERGWRILNFGIFNLNKEVRKGEFISDYRGFFIRYAIFLPFEKL